MSNQVSFSPDTMANVVLLPRRPGAPEREPGDRADTAAAETNAGATGRGLRYCASVPLLGKRYYIAVSIGREKRKIGRLAAEAHTKSWLHTTVSLSATLMFAATLLMSSLATAYLLKSVLGVDLFDESFFMHGGFFN